MKKDQNITFIKSCKKENLVPTFTKVNLSINSGSYKLKCEISKLIMQNWRINIMKRENWG